MRNRRLAAAFALVVLASIGVARLTGCAGGTHPEDKWIRLALNGATLALDVDALSQGGATADERQALRTHIGWTIVNVTDGDARARAIALVLETNGTLTSEEQAELDALLAPYPKIAGFVALALEMHTSGTFNEPDWRSALAAFVAWAGQPPPP